MEIDRGAVVALETHKHQALIQWELKASGPLDGAVHIQAGTLASGGWYVRHVGFGSRRFRDKQAAWQAVRVLMTRHEGRWQQVGIDPGPFVAVCRPDGSRVLYDMNDDVCLHACWGDQRDRLWARYEAAIDAGVTLRRTETHALLEGYIELVRYDDPLDGNRRYAVATSEDAGYRVVDHADRHLADAEYEHFVLSNADDEFPYKSSDIIDVPVDRKSKPPAGLSVLPSGVIIATDDLEEYHHVYGPPPRMRWPRTAELAIAPGAVCGMTAEPRHWGPTAVSVREVTPQAWNETDDELRPNALALAALPDGRQLLASGHDGGAHVWTIGDGKRVRMLSGHSEWVLSVALTVLCDGRCVVATGGKDGLARIWSAREGTALLEIEGHSRPVNSVAWACPPGDVPWLVTGGDDATVRLWDAETGLSLKVFETGAPGVHLVWSVAATVLSDGHVCVVAGVDDVDMNVATVRVWDGTTGTDSHEFIIERGGGSMPSPPKVAVAPLVDRSFRVAAIAGRVVRVWDGHTGEVVQTLSVRDDGGADIALAVLPDLRVVVAATGGRETLVWDVESGAVLARLDHAVGGLPKAVDVVARPDGGLLLASGRKDDNPARLLEIGVRW